MKVICNKARTSCPRNCPHVKPHEGVEWYSCDGESAYCSEIDEDCICIPTATQDKEA